jgi:protein-tyrosine kinase
VVDQVTTTTDSDARHRIRDMHSTEKLSRNELAELGIIHPGMTDQSLLNCYRDIRNKLLGLSDYKNFVCLVTSISPFEETSLLSLNLASVFALDKSRSALVVDCSADRNVIDSLISVEETIGLIDFIELDYDDMSSLLYECSLDRVRLIPAGRLTETRTETLESTRMREIIIELKQRYADRFIFINAPNMTTSSEVHVLSNISDMVLFELSPGTVTSTQVTEAIEMIGPEKVAGVLFRET